MDQPYLSEYAEVVGKEIFNYLVEQRQGRGSTDRRLKNEDVIFRLSSNEDWLPSTREARFNLLEDSTSFTFTMPNEDQELRFHSARKGEEKIFVSLPLKSMPDQEITLFADFDRRVFLKEVTSQNPLEREMMWSLLAPWISLGERWNGPRVRLSYPTRQIPIGA